MLCQLGATVRLREELEAWLPGFLAEDAEDAEAQAPEAEYAGTTEHAEEEGEPEPEGETVQA